jgi:CRP-like cAMP-binding protein
MLSEGTLAILAKTEIFEGVPHDALSQLGRFTFEFTAGRDEMVIAEGVPGDALYVVLEGRLQVVLLKIKPGQPARRFSDVSLNELKPHDCFGEYSLFDRQPASASVVALEPCRLCKLTRSNFDQFLAGNDRVARTIYHNLLRILIRRLRRKDQEIDLTLDYD